MSSGYKYIPPENAQASAQPQGNARALSGEKEGARYGSPSQQKLGDRCAMVWRTGIAYIGVGFVLSLQGI